MRGTPARFQQPAGERQHWLSAPPGTGGHEGAAGDPGHHRARHRQPCPRRSGEAHRRPRRRRASVRCSSLTPGRMPMRTRFAWRGSIPGATRCCRPIVPIMATPAARSPLPATGAGCRMSSPAATFTSSTPTFTAASSTPRLRKRSASARWRICGGSLNARGRRPSRRSCWSPSPAPPGSSCRRQAICRACAPPADEFGIVLILDEVMAGFGRTGSWFAFEQDGVVPDLVTFARGLTPATCRRAGC